MKETKPFKEFTLEEAMGIAAHAAAEWTEVPSVSRVLLKEISRLSSALAEAQQVIDVYKQERQATKEALVSLNTRLDLYLSNVKELVNAIPSAGGIAKPLRFSVVHSDADHRPVGKGDALVPDLPQEADGRSGANPLC